MNIILLLLSLFLVESVSPQQHTPFVADSTVEPQKQYTGFAQELFFGRLPSAKSEAMGRILVLNVDPYFVSQSNPANLASTNGVSVFYAYSSPYYGYTDATYNYIGLSYNNPVVGAIAFNVLNFSTGSSLLINEKKQVYTLTYSNQILNWFSFGINANLFVANFGTDKTFSDSFFELGVARDFNVVQNSGFKDHVTIGMQLKNIFNQSFSAIDQAQADPFPQIFRIGISNLFKYIDNQVFDKASLVGLLVGFEYQDLLNSDKRTTYKVGGELSFLEIIFLRSGYYSETPTFSEGKLTDFTYGFGLEIDFDKYITVDFPLVLSFDFASLKQPSYYPHLVNWESFSTFSVIANYRIK